MSEFSIELHRLADKITSSMNELLWDKDSNDHYITQLNADLITTRDFIDYDANLLAVAFGVTPDSRVGNLLTRVDSGAYTHVRGTWCCEVPYSGDAEDCYIVGGDVCGGNCLHILDHLLVAYNAMTCHVDAISYVCYVMSYVN